MAKSETRVRLSLDDQFSKGIGKAAKSADSFGKSASLSLIGIEAAINLTGKALDALQQGFDLAEEGAMLMRLKETGDVLAASMGQNMGSIVEAIQKASNNTISEASAMSAALMALRTNVARTPEEFAKLTTAALALGRAAGRNATDALNDLTIGTSKMSKMILDNLNIIKPLPQIYEEYAEKMGIAANTMDDFQKKQAIINEAMEGAAPLLDEQGKLVTDDAEAFERLNAKLEDITGTLKEAAVPAMKALIETMEPLLEVIISGQNATARSEKRFDTWTKSVKFANMTGNEMIDKIKQIGIQTDSLNNSQLLNLRTWDFQFISREEAIVQLAKYGIEVGNVTQTTDEFSTAIEEAAFLEEDLARATKVVKDGLELLGPSMPKNDLDELTERFEQLDEDLEEGIIKLPKYAELMRRLAGDVAKAGSEIGGIGDDIDELPEVKRILFSIGIQGNTFEQAIEDKRRDMAGGGFLDLTLDVLPEIDLTKVDQDWLDGELARGEALSMLVDVDIEALSEEDLATLKEDFKAALGLSDEEAEKLWSNYGTKGAAVIKTFADNFIRTVKNVLTPEGGKILDQAQEDLDQYNSDLASIFGREYVLNVIFSRQGFDLPGRAHGGFVPSGLPVEVGEQGSEFIFPQGNGFVVVDAVTTQKLKDIGLVPGANAALGLSVDADDIIRPTKALFHTPVPKRRPLRGTESPSRRPLRGVEGIGKPQIPAPIFPFGIGVPLFGTPSPGQQFADQQARLGPPDAEKIAGRRGSLGFRIDKAAKQIFDLGSPGRRLDKLRTGIGAADAELRAMLLTRDNLDIVREGGGAFAQALALRPEENVFDIIGADTAIKAPGPGPIPEPVPSSPPAQRTSGATETVNIAPILAAVSSSAATVGQAVASSVSSDKASASASQAASDNAQLQILQRIAAAVEKSPDADELRDIMRETQDTSGF